MSESFIILGAGRGAREVFWFLQDAHPGAGVVFVDDVTDTREVVIDGQPLPLVKDWDFSETGANRGESGFAGFLVGIGEPGPKRIMVEKALAKGLTPAPPLVTPHSVVRPDCRLGRGGIIGSHSMLTTNVTVGDYVLLFNSTIGSETVIGDFSTIYAGSHIASGACLAEGVCIGAATVVREDVRVAAGVRTGASSCVTRDVDEVGIIVVGVPARPLAS